MNLDVLPFINRMMDISAACRSWYVQCTLRSRPWTLTGTVLGMVVIRLLLCNDRCPGWGAQKTVESPQLPFFWGSRNAWFDHGYMFCIIQGGFWKYFYDFLHEMEDSAPEVDSPSWPARRRHRQWHVPYWFCWFDAPRAMFPRLPAVCRSMLQLLASCAWKSLHHFLRACCIFRIFHVQNFARVDFLGPSSTHSCECSRAGGAGVARSLLPGDSAPGLCQFTPRGCCHKHLL